MQKLSREYLVLFNAVTDAEEVLRRLRAELMEAQRLAEELFMEQPEAEGRGG